MDVKRKKDEATAAPDRYENTSSFKILNGNRTICFIL